MKFKDRLKELRLAKNLTQKELADCTGFSISIINKWENGRFTPSMQAVIKLSEFFGESMEYIAGLID